MYIILAGLLVTCLSLAAFGGSQAILPMAVFAFLLMAPLPMVNALFMSIMQAKVPPDLQGRVFAVIGQASMLLSPLAYLIVGPLADNVFEPAVAVGGWDIVAPVVGSGTGAGMGLMYVGAGSFVFLLTLVIIAIRPIREMETVLPDYKPVVAADDGAAATDTQTVPAT
jgi:hypothetical protein